MDEVVLEVRNISKNFGGTVPDRYFYCCHLKKIIHLSFSAYEL